MVVVAPPRWCAVHYLGLRRPFLVPFGRQGDALALVPPALDHEVAVLGVRKKFKEILCSRGHRREGHRKNIAFVSELPLEHQVSSLVNDDVLAVVVAVVVAVGLVVRTVAQNAAGPSLLNGNFVVVSSCVADQGYPVVVVVVVVAAAVSDVSIPSTDFCLGCHVVFCSFVGDSPGHRRQLATAKKALGGVQQSCQQQNLHWKGSDTKTAFPHVLRPMLADFRVWSNPTLKLLVQGR
mmetsp:Transcript_25418/g.55858  ORF Transcript_25418/g.55858 Transcript_25418/m.55858 type:complete len:236 (+) Transcript_25418:366-1073(+)